jgi:F-type H+-transporting ATPase subunit epsilon
MAEKIELEIVTPKGRMLSVAVDEVTVPSVDGEFGVLPGHLPLLAALRTGLVTYRQGGESTRVAVGPGFAEAGPDKLGILTDDFADREHLDPVIIRKDLAEVQEQLQSLEAVPLVAPEARGGEAEAVDARTRRDHLVAKQNWLAAQLELYGDPPAATQRPYEEFGPPAPMPDDEVPGTDDPHATGPTGTSNVR